ncbi:hypothetical protein ACU4GD_45510 [Cupriavidus basilensis]
MKQLQSNVAIGYAVTYVFGSLGAIIVLREHPAALHRERSRTSRPTLWKVEPAMRGGTPQFWPGPAWRGCRAWWAACSRSPAPPGQDRGERSRPRARTSSRSRR